tara:strand:+ start:575 stop:853 length:279 start_codon:yes stop_codon:yes gene_type:complete
MVKWEYLTVLFSYLSRRKGFRVQKDTVAPRYYVKNNDFVRDNQYEDGRDLVKDFDEWMNDFGSEGWEAYSIESRTKDKGVSQFVFFKRRLED